MIDDDIDQYGLGWAFYKLDGIKGGATMPETLDTEWLDGFCAALAEYPDDQDCSIETALLIRGIPALEAAKLLESSSQAKAEGWKRWPSLPLRSNHVLINDTLATASAKIFGYEMG